MIFVHSPNLPSITCRLLNTECRAPFSSSFSFSFPPSLSDNNHEPMMMMMMMIMIMSDNQEAVKKPCRFHRHDILTVFQQTQPSSIPSDSGREIEVSISHDQYQSVVVDTSRS